MIKDIEAMKEFLKYELLNVTYATGLVRHAYPVLTLRPGVRNEALYTHGKLTGPVMVEHHKLLNHMLASIRAEYAAHTCSYCNIHIPKLGDSCPSCGNMP